MKLQKEALCSLCDFLLLLIVRLLYGFFGCCDVRKYAVKYGRVGSSEKLPAVLCCRRTVILILIKYISMLMVGVAIVEL